MSYVTTKDDVEIFYKDWASRMLPSFFSITAGPSAQMTGTRRCCSLLGRAFGLSRTTVGDMGDRLRFGMDTTWITMPTTSRQL